jgi:hypothetical protein
MPVGGDFYRIESARLDVRAEVSALFGGNVLELDLQKMDFANLDQGQQLSILYKYGDKEAVAEAFTPTPEVRQTLAASQTGELPIAIQQRALIHIAPDPREFADRTLHCGLHCFFLDRAGGLCLARSSRVNADTHTLGRYGYCIADQSRCGNADSRRLFTYRFECRFLRNVPVLDGVYGAVFCDGSIFLAGDAW